MIPGALTRRYSRALFDLCANSQERITMQEELSRFAAALTESSELRQLVENPAFSTNERKATLTNIFKTLSLSKGSSNFLSYLLDRDRLQCIDGIVEDFGRRLDSELKRVRAEIISAKALSTSDVTRAKAALKKLTGCDEVILDCQVDPSVIGGAVTRIGNVVLDSSIKNQIEGLREHLLAG